MKLYRLKNLEDSIRVARFADELESTVSRLGRAFNQAAESLRGYKVAWDECTARLERERAQRKNGRDKA